MGVSRYTSVFVGCSRSSSSAIYIIVCVCQLILVRHHLSIFHPGLFSDIRVQARFRYRPTSRLIFAIEERGSTVILYFSGEIVVPLLKYRKGDWRFGPGGSVRRSLTWSRVRRRNGHMFDPQSYKAGRRSLWVVKAGSELEAEYRG
jgi:hypothetical protein